MLIKKSNSARNVFVILLLSAFFLMALSPLPQEPAGDTVLDKILIIATGFASLVGVAALVEVLIALGKAVKIITSDEQIGKIRAGLNLAFFVALVLFGVFRPDLSLDFLDSVAAKIATVALFVLGFIVQMTSSAPLLRLAYQARVPVLGVMGADTEYRAHVINREYPNWTAGPDNPPK